MMSVEKSSGGGGSRVPPAVKRWLLLLGSDVPLAHGSRRAVALSDGGNSEGLGFIAWLQGRATHLNYTASLLIGESLLLLAHISYVDGRGGLLGRLIEILFIGVAC
jgi:hypothetical protein